MAVIKRLGKYGVQVYRDGEREWVGTFDSHREAKEAERDALGSPLIKNRETCEDFAKRWVEQFNSVHSDGTLRWSEEHARGLTSALKPFIERFGDERMAKFPTREALPWAAKQKHFTLKAIRSMFNDAVKSDVTGSNPFANLGLERSRGRRDIVAITESELDLLAECARDVAEDPEHGEIMRALLLWQGLVGTRMIGASNLRPDDVDTDNARAYVRKPGKKVPPRTVYVPEKALRAVQRMPARLGADWLFTSRRGSKLTKSNLHYAWEPIRVSFDRQLDPRRAAELREARRGGGLIQFHELRHAAATNMARRGVDPETAAWQLCQTDGGDLVRRVYTHLNDSERHEFMRRAFTEAPSTANRMHGEADAL